MPTILTILIILIAAFLILNPERETLDDEIRAHIGGDFITLPDGVVHYEIKGDKNKPLVVLVHGFSTPAYIWEPTFQALQQAGFQVLRFDLYGRGLSDRPDLPYNLDLFVRQLDQLVKGLQISKPFHLMGLSMGGPIAAAYAGRNPAAVRTLTLIDPLVTNMFKEKIFPLNIKGVGEYLMAVLIIPFILPKSQCGDFAHPENYPDWGEKYKPQTRYKGFRRAILSTMREVGKQDTVRIYEMLGKKDIPTLIFRGKLDQTISAEAIRTLRELVSGNEFHEIDGAGHIPHYEKADVVNPLLISFLERHN